MVKEEPGTILAEAIFAPLLVPLKLINAQVAATKGGQVSERPTTLPRANVKRGNAAYRGVTPTFPSREEVFTTPRNVRRQPVPVPRKPREVRGPGARTFGTLARGGELYSRDSKGHLTSQHEPVRTTIF